VLLALRTSFEQERRGLQSALAEIDAAGWLNGVDVLIVSGPEEYLFGEETALLEVLDGRDPFPRIAPPFRRGVDEIPDVSTESTSESTSAAGVELAGTTRETIAPPTLVNNVETIANVPSIVAEGVDWFRALGTKESPGTVVCTISGATVRDGVGEVAMGTPLRAAIDQIAGGPRAGRTLTGAMGGVSNALITETQLDTPLTHEAMAAIGTGLGCGAFIVFDDQTDFTAVAAGVARFLAVESCGQCTPCKQDGLALAELFETLSRSKADASTLASIEDRLSTVADSARCNLASQYQTVLRSILDSYGTQVHAHAEGRAEPVELTLIAPIVDLEDGRATLEHTHLDKQPDWTYEAVWSGQSPADRRAGPDPQEER
jgi:NADH-quinone oxidoreductase subunit F